MPYSVNNPPKIIEGLPGHAREIFIAAYNTAYKDNPDEESCHRIAWAAVKKNYKEEGGKWIKLAELETVDLPDVEILAPGTWKGNKEVIVPPEALEAFVGSFNELTGNKEVNYEPPAKLGHSDEQTLLQKDGYPSAGWVKALKVRAGKLVADFRGVPAKLAEIIKAGGYKKVSAEFYKDYEIGGKKYPWVLKAVSFLGADIPAVKSIGDITALYAELTDESGVSYLAVTSEKSLDEKADAVRNAFRSQFNRPGIGENWWVTEVYPGFVVVEVGGKLYKAIYAEADGAYVFENLLEVKKVVEYQVILNTEESMNESEIRKLLGLDETADVLAAITALKAKSESETTRLAEAQGLTAENAKLKSQLTEILKAATLKERDERIGAAIAAGKILPAQKEALESFVMSDPAGFDKYIAAQPVIVKTGEAGHSGDTAPVALTEAERKIAALMGVDEKMLIASKLEESKK